MRSPSMELKKLTVGNQTINLEPLKAKRSQGFFAHARTPQPLAARLISAGLAAISGGRTKYTRVNRGGMIPGYNMGGMVSPQMPKSIPIPAQDGRYNMGGMVPKGYAMGGMVGTMLGSTAGYMGGSALGSMLGGNMGSMIGGMAGMMAIPAIMSGSGRAADDATPKVGKFKSALTALTALPGPVKAIGALIAIGTVIKNINDRVNEHRKIINLAFAPTEESAQRLGIKYNSLTEQLKEFSEQTKLSKANIEEYYAATQNSGVPGLNLTIKQLKELKSTVEKDFPDYVKMFNIAKPDEVISKAQQLKAQLVSGGMGAEEATKKIFAMISVSLKRISSCSPSLTVVPPNSGNNTVSPTLTETGSNFPLMS
jgi:hypothetical protein